MITLSKYRLHLLIATPAFRRFSPTVRPIAADEARDELGHLLDLLALTLLDIRGGYQGGSFPYVYFVDSLESLSHV